MSAIFLTFKKCKMSIERLEVVLVTCTLNPMVKKTIARFTLCQSSLFVSGKDSVGVCSSTHLQQPRPVTKTITALLKGLTKIQSFKKA